VQQYWADAGSLGAEVPLSEWRQRMQTDHHQWRQQAGSICCAVLQQQAGPDDAARCEVCGTNQSTIRQVSARCVTGTWPAVQCTVRQWCWCCNHAQLRPHLALFCCRCMTCCPSQGPTLMCSGCDSQMHRYAHLHQRQQYVGHWQDLPLVAEPGDVPCCCAVSS
jgi:hypothetical protein